MTPSPALPLQRHHGMPLWALILLLLLAVGAWSAWNAYSDYRDVLEQEYRLLEERARQREARISGSLRSVNLMLGSIIDDLHDHPSLAVTERNHLLRSYLRQLPELRSLLITDAAGRVSAADNEKLIGFDAVKREYFKVHRDAPGDDGFHISLPFKTVTGIIATTLSRVRRDSQGRFAGVIVATLESGFFSEALKLSAFEPGVQSLLINLHGDVLSQVPPSDRIGKNLQGGIAYTEHMSSGKATTRHLNVVKLEPVMKMAVFHNLPGAPLAVIVSRNYDSVLADWRLSMYSHLGSFILLALTTLFFSRLAARRQQSLIRAQVFSAQLIETANVMVLGLDAAGCVSIYNSTAERITGYTRAEILGKPWFELVVPKERFPELWEGFRHIQASGKIARSFESTIVTKSGEERTIEWQNSRLEDDTVGAVTVSFGLDVTDRNKAEAEIRSLAFNDPLTGLPNRRLLLDRLERALRISERHKNYGAVLFLDLDKFKLLNDTRGHEVGDLLLMAIAHRLLGSVRAEDTVARLGGDEFVLVLEDLGQDAQVARSKASEVAEKIRLALNAPYSLQGQAHESASSIGICLFSGTEATVSELLTRADKAMYSAKMQGGGGPCFFDAISRAQPYLP